MFTNTEQLKLFILQKVKEGSLTKFEKQVLEIIQHQIPAGWIIREQTFGSNGFYICNAVNYNPIYVLSIRTLLGKIKLIDRSKRFVYQTEANVQRIGKLAAETIKKWELQDKDA